MQYEIFESPAALGQAAAAAGAVAIREALEDRGEANIILATGASQFATLEALVAARDIDWSRVRGFHLDEYVGLASDHPASFVNYLRQRFVEKLPTSPAHFEFIDGTADPEVECERLARCLHGVSIDVAFIGIGENGHLAFNDPPANFETKRPYLIVELDEACRQQQLGEGWFPTLEDVPRRAISMSVHQIMQSQHIICSVPDERKAEAVAAAIQGALTPHCPASILRVHSHATLYLDRPAASRLVD